MKNKIVVYNTIPFGPEIRRNKRAKTYEPLTAFYLQHFDGSSCIVQKCGKGFHNTIEVAQDFLVFYVPGEGHVPFNSISFRELMKALGV